MHKIHTNTGKLAHKYTNTYTETQKDYQIQRQRQKMLTYTECILRKACTKMDLFKSVFYTNEAPLIKILMSKSLHREISVQRISDEIKKSCYQ